ncbi:MAG TPA: DUF4440 domain-containing protein, partial [Steroidobacteraceae bacterium]|nr:DUF4440 domain-containing protein [Steroidobacteraceae bacterium]
MKTPALFAFGMMIFSFASWNHGACAAPADAARAAIAAQAARFTAALSEGQAAAAAAYFTDDARLSLPGISGVLEGRSAVEQFWQAVLGNGMKSLALATRDLEGQGDLRVETGRYSAFGADHQALGSGEYLIVWKRVGGEWKIHRDYAHPADGGAPPADTVSATPTGATAELPRDYAKTLRRMGDTAFNESTGKLSTVYANALAASTQ